MQKTHVLLIAISLLLWGCAKNPIRSASPEQLKAYPTDTLLSFATDYKNLRYPDAEVTKELKDRFNQDIKLLIDNATHLNDFEHLRYEPMSATLASEIFDKYPHHAVDVTAFWAARKEWYIKNNKSLSPETKKRILETKSCYEHKLTLGMTKSDVLAAIGSPNDINTTKGSWGTREQWVYGGIVGRRHFPSRYFYFTDGKLSATQY